MKKEFTYEEVIILLQKQRQLCSESAKIKTNEYINEYSESDGEISHIIDKNSIINAILTI